MHVKVTEEKETQIEATAKTRTVSIDRKPGGRRDDRFLDGQFFGDLRRRTSIRRDARVKQKPTVRNRNGSFERNVYCRRAMRNFDAPSNTNYPQPKKRKTA